MQTQSVTNSEAHEVPCLRRLRFEAVCFYSMLHEPWFPLGSWFCSPERAQGSRCPCLLLVSDLSTSLYLLALIPLFQETPVGLP